MARVEALAAAVIGALRPGWSAPGLLGALVGAAGLAASFATHAANTFYVNTTGDPGPPGTLSLRQAVALSSQGDDILFDPSLVGSTITLAQGAISIDHAVYITGFSGPSTITISGANADRIFDIDISGNSGSYVSYVSVARVKLAQGFTTGCGGAIYANNSQLIFRESSVTGSSAAFGGGLCARGVGSAIGMEKSRVSANSARLGGGLYVGNSTYLIIARSTISGNSALDAGGGIYAAGVDLLSISNSLISANTVPAPHQYFYTSQGGGMVAAGIGSVLQIRATTIGGNSAFASGGAIRILDGLSADRTRLVNVTVVGNGSGGGGALSASGGAPQIESSIVANNPGGDLFGTFNADYSLITDPSGAQISGSKNLFGADPQLAPLADHGGLTFCMLPAPGSPVINAGKVDPLPGHTDQRGYPIVGVIDIGAVERQYPEDIVFRDGFDPT